MERTPLDQRSSTTVLDDSGGGSSDGCPVAHATQPSTPAAPLAASAAGCPVAHATPAAAVSDEAAVCPFPHAAKPARVVRRTRADVVVRKVLRIKERPVGATSAAAYAAFRRSMLISATRCTLTYVVFPFVLPAVGFATGVGPIIGILIGTLALTCDVLTIRRFFAIDHKWRWHYSAVASCIIVLLLVLLVQDIIHLVT